MMFMAERVGLSVDVESPSPYPSPRDSAVLPSLTRGALGGCGIELKGFFAGLTYFVRSIDASIGVMRKKIAVRSATTDATAMRGPVSLGSARRTPEAPSAR